MDEDDVVGFAASPCLPLVSLTSNSQLVILDILQQRCIKLQLATPNNFRVHMCWSPVEPSLLVAIGSQLFIVDVIDLWNYENPTLESYFSSSFSVAKGTVVAYSHLSWQLDNSLSLAPYIVFDGICSVMPGHVSVNSLRDQTATFQGYDDSLRFYFPFISPSNVFSLPKDIYVSTMLTSLSNNIFHVIGLKLSVDLLAINIHASTPSCHPLLNCTSEIKQVCHLTNDKG